MCPSGMCIARSRGSDESFCKEFSEVKANMAYTGRKSYKMWLIQSHSSMTEAEGTLSFLSI